MSPQGAEQALGRCQRDLSQLREASFELSVGHLRTASGNQLETAEAWGRDTVLCTVLSPLRGLSLPSGD